MTINRLKKRLLVPAAVALAAMVAAVHAQSAHMMLKGTVTDTMCPKKHMMEGSAAKCTMECVQGGADFALVAGDKVYTLKGDKAEIGKFAGATVTVEGDASGTTLTVKTIKAAE